MESPRSGSVAATMPTTVSLGLFSSTLNDWLSTTGASLRLFRSIVTVAVSVNNPESSTSTVSANEGMVSKSN